MTGIHLGLGRRVQFDERSRAFSVGEVVPQDAPIETTFWQCNAFLDQGSEGACVGFGFAHEIAADPVPLSATASLALRIYREAQKIDQWPGEDYDGTSVLAGAKILQKWGYMPEYRWAFSLEDALRALCHLGPLVIGVNWYEGMFEPAQDGFIRPTGALRGGHCICVVGISTEFQALRLHNSWGKRWGSNGECWISIEDFDRLRKEQGEVCIPLTRAQGAEPAAPKPPRRPSFLERIFGPRKQKYGPPIVDKHSFYRLPGLCLGDEGGGR